MAIQDAQRIIAAAKVARGIPSNTICACCEEVISPDDIASDDDFNESWLADIRKGVGAGETAAICSMCANDAPNCPACDGPGFPNHRSDGFCSDECADNEAYATAEHRLLMNHPYR